jgi:hypothetical protein
MPRRTLNGASPGVETEALRNVYRPERVRVLFVGESPPVSGAFFYQADPIHPLLTPQRRSSARCWAERKTLFIQLIGQQH